MSFRLRIRTLKGGTFDLSVDPDATLAQVKQQIEQEKGHPAAHQKLIYNGAILADTNTVKQSNIKENGFVVMMVKAPAGGAAPAAATTPVSKPAAAQAEPAQVAEAPKPAAESPKPAAGGEGDGVAPMDTSPDSVSGAESTLLTDGGQIEATVTQLCEMGFPRDQVVAALRAAFNNPNRAVEYLMSGNIPQTAGPPAGGPPAVPPAVAAAAGAGGGAGQAPGGAVNLFEAAEQARAGGGAGANAGPEGENVFGFLRQSPQFNALRFMVQQNPALLEPVLAQLGQQNPQLLQLITQHQEEFTQLLNEPVNEADLPQGMPGMPGGGGGGGGMPPGAVQIQLTQEEADAVQRLQDLGFSQQACLEAFLSCDKNEEIAANFLLENGDAMDFGDDEFEEAGDFDGGFDGGAM